MKSLLALSLAILAPVAALAAADTAARPNSVFIFADDFGYGDPSCYGGRDAVQCANRRACSRIDHVVLLSTPRVVIVKDEPSAGASPLWHSAAPEAGP